MEDYIHSGLLSLLRMKVDFVIRFLLYFHCTTAATISGVRRAESISAVLWLSRDDPELHSDISCIQNSL